MRERTSDRNLYREWCPVKRRSESEGKPRTSQSHDPAKTARRPAIEIDADGKNHTTTVTIKDESLNLGFMTL